MVTIAKITRPGSAGILARKRLFDLLDRGRESSVIFIVGPPGSGKTALASSYLDVRKIPCLWYKMDDGDADLASFFHYMGIAAKKLSPKRGKPLPVFTPEYIQATPVFSRRYFEELFARTGTPFTVVFDNYQDLPSDSGFHEMISRGLSDVPKGINVFFLSRKAPPLPFAHMYADNRICIYGWEEIKFTFEETKEFVRPKVPVTVTDKTIRYFHKKTDGWATGIVLMLERLKENVENQALDGLSSSNIFDYFACEIFQKMDGATQEFLLKTAFLQGMTARVAEQLSGIHRSEEILSWLSKDNSFIETDFQERGVYRYHPLFGEFLKSMANEFFKSAELINIKRNSALLLEESGNIEDAVHLLRDCGDTEQLTGIIQKWAPSLVKQGRYQTLHNWLNYLPGEVLSNNPWLRYWMGISRLPFNPYESLTQFETIFHQFRSRKEAEGTFLTWCGIVESIMYGSEGLEPLDRWIFSVEELLKEFNGFPSEDIEANVTCSLIRCLALRRPADFNMKKWADRIQEIIQKGTDISMKIKASINLSCYLYSEGNFQNLEILLESLNGLLKNHDIPPLSRLTIDWVRAAHFNVTSQYYECRKVIKNGLKLAGALKINLMEYLLLGHGVLSSLKKGDLETAKQNLQSMVSALSFIKPWEISFFHYCSAWEALYRNDLAHASTHAEHCMKLCQGLGNPWTLSLSHLLSAYVDFAFGEIKKSMNHIVQARSIGIGSENAFTPFICLITEAYFYIKQGKELSAIEAIRKGLLIGRRKGFVNLFMSQRDVLGTVLAKALDAGIEVSYAKTLIQQNGIICDPSGFEVEQWPWPLKIFTLGRFAILKDGKPVHFSGKVQHKPLAMLQALIALGGRDVSEDRISDLLWSEADGDAAHSAFATTLSRLRNFLGVEHAIKFQEGKASLDQRYCWVDVWVFERILGKVDAAWNEIMRSSDRDLVIQLTEKANKIYTGPFLAGDNEPWAISMRERLRNKLLRNVKRLGRYWEESGNTEKALECYHKGLEVDDLIEEFYRGSIQCHLQMGRRAEALATYKRCHKILSSVLGVEPSPETVALVKNLKS